MPSDLDDEFSNCLMTWMILREPPFVENLIPVIIQKHQPKDTMLDKTRSQRFLKVSQFLIILEMFRFSITVNAVVGRCIFDTLTLCGDGACWEIPRCEPCPQYDQSAFHTNPTKNYTDSPKLRFHQQFIMWMYVDVTEK